MAVTEAPVEEPVVATPPAPADPTPEELDPLLKYRKTQDDDIYWKARKMYDQMCAQWNDPWTHTTLSQRKSLRDP